MKRTLALRTGIKAMIVVLSTLTGLLSQPSAHRQIAKNISTDLAGSANPTHGFRLRTDNPPPDFNDLRSIDQARAAAALQPLLDFEENVEWANRAMTAIQSGHEPPPRPAANWGTTAVIQRLDKLNAFIAAQLAHIPPPPPIPPAASLHPDQHLKERVAAYIAAQEEYLATLAERQQLLAQVKERVDGIRSLSQTLATKLTDLLGAGLPDPTEQVQLGAYDLSVTIPKATVPVSDAAKTAGKAHDAAIQRFTKSYKAWSDAARQTIDNFDRQKQGIHDGIGDGRATAHSPRGSSHGGGDITGTVSVGAPLVVSVPGVPGSFEAWLFPPSMDPGPFSQSPEFMVAPGRSALILPAFPSLEAWIEVYALYDDGSWVSIQQFSGQCSADGTAMTWKNTARQQAVLIARAWRKANHARPLAMSAIERVRLRRSHISLKLPVRHIHATASDTDATREYLDRSTRDRFKELAVTAWGYKPERPMGASNPTQGYQSNEAVLILAHMDDTASSELERLAKVAQPVDVQQPSLFLWRLAFIGERTTVSMEDQPPTGGAAPFWGPITDQRGAGYGYIDPNAINGSIVINAWDEKGGHLPMSWRGNWVNPEIFVVGSSSQNLGPRAIPFNDILLSVMLDADCR